MAKIGELRGWLLLPFDCKWNALIRDVTAEYETHDEEVDEREVFKELVSQVRQSGYLDHSFPTRNRLAELFNDPISGTSEDYVAWLCWRGDETHRHLVLCDSDSDGAFKVYRHPGITL